MQPKLTTLAGFNNIAVSGILLLFNAEMIAGNLLDGELAGRKLVATLLGSIVVLGLMTFAMRGKVSAAIFVGLLGAAEFATVAPLQVTVLKYSGSAGQTLASSLNIGAFNLGNAIGAWAGGWALASGPGLGAIPWVAALITASAACVALWSVGFAGRKTMPACPGLAYGAE